MTPENTYTEDEDLYKEAKDFPKTAFVVSLDRFLSVSASLKECRMMLGMALDNQLSIQNKADMWRDEFLRIKSLCFGKSLEFLEIEGICNRALDEIAAKVSLIEQREIVAQERDAMREKLWKAEEAFQKIIRSVPACVNGFWFWPSISPDGDYLGEIPTDPAFAMQEMQEIAETALAKLQNTNTP
jgi:hypothetical protein